MNVLITAGGTVEMIDAVRSITNTSTGMLGSLIAMEFEDFSDIEKIYYICGRQALRPESDKTEIIPVGNVAELELAVRGVLKESRIDIIVHCMAVSDYKVKHVTSAALLANAMADQTEPSVTGNFRETDVTHLLEKCETVISGSGKISSDIDNMILLMERTPKIISIFKELVPDALLVGFKLLDNVSHDALIDAAYRVLTVNKCSYVLANDMKDIDPNQHIGYLVDEEKGYSRYSTKQEIAEAITAVTIEKRRSK